MSGLSRRDVLRNLTVGAMGGSALKMIPAQAAEFAHHLVQQEKAASPAGNYVPHCFIPHEYETLSTLCEIIIPADEKSGGAIQAGAPEFIDLLSSENDEYALLLRGGLMWLDNFCTDRYERTFLECDATQRTEVLDLIAYRKNAETDHTLHPGIKFFAMLRRMTSDAFYTSKIGLSDIQYIGNTALAQFPGCPPFPDA